MSFWTIRTRTLLNVVKPSLGTIDRLARHNGQQQRKGYEQQFHLFTFSCDTRACACRVCALWRDDPIPPLLVVSGTRLPVYADHQLAKTETDGQHWFATEWTLLSTNKRRQRSAYDLKYTTRNKGAHENEIQFHDNPSVFNMHYFYNPNTRQTDTQQKRKSMAQRCVCAAGDVQTRQTSPTTRFSTAPRL